jgi:TusA-related sulfurtransferase
MTAVSDNITPSKTVDARGMACPGPLLEVRKAIGTIAVGETVEIRTGDSGSREDIPAWCRKTGQEYAGYVERDGYDSLYVTRRR